MMSSQTSAWALPIRDIEGDRTPNIDQLKEIFQLWFIGIDQVKLDPADLWRKFHLSVVPKLELVWVIKT